MQQIINKIQTPLEKLISDKEHIRKQCVEQEHKLNQDFLYIQENAPSLLLSGFSALLFPNTKAKKTDSTQTVAVSNQPAAATGLADYLAIAQGLLPVAWDIARPFLVTWGIRKAQSLFTNLLFRKKK